MQRWTRWFFAFARRLVVAVVVFVDRQSEIKREGQERRCLRERERKKGKSEKDIGVAVISNVMFAIVKGGKERKVARVDDNKQ